jgi:hypothetical protein
MSAASATGTARNQYIQRECTTHANTRRTSVSTRVRQAEIYRRLSRKLGGKPVPQHVDDKLNVFAMIPQATHYQREWRHRAGSSAERRPP